MSPVGHFVTASALSYSIVAHFGIPWRNIVFGIWTQPFITYPPFVYQEQAISIFSIAVILGGRLPDRLEIPYINRTLRTRESLIPHRTITHWPALWVILSAFAYFAIIHAQTLIGMVGALFLLGLCAASWLHLLFDIMTPMGIPLSSPFGERFSFNIYRSGSAKEAMIIAVFLLLCLAGAHLHL